MAVNTVGYTSQITAGFRAVELAHNKKPIIVDHLAQHLAGAALHTALADYQQLQQAQGPGRSLRVPARNRIMDDFVLEALQLLQQQQQQQLDGDGVVQVVHIGCGMACELLRSMRALSGAGSCLAATCIDAELQQAHLRLPSQHYFSTNKVAWHFSMDELAAAIGAAGWRMQGQPQTAAQLARERYGRETYVALYGGAECCFTAVPG
ncbi:hypothetical protein OEZ86_002698 [Tetradesmus obliquus]|nr:hypothetical protein OEZ86_002698 [Tetradesmus obliquus]